jgi:predicted nuclease with TOPRIM domain
MSLSPEQIAALTALVAGGAAAFGALLGHLMKWRTDSYELKRKQWEDAQAERDRLMSRVNKAEEELFNLRQKLAAVIGSNRRLKKHVRKLSAENVFLQDEIALLQKACKDGGLDVPPLRRGGDAKMQQQLEQRQKRSTRDD